MRSRPPWTLVSSHLPPAETEEALPAGRADDLIDGRPGSPLTMGVSKLRPRAGLNAEGDVDLLGGKRRGLLGFDLRPVEAVRL